MSKLSGGDFEYKPQVNIGRVIDNGEGWLNDGEVSLISKDTLCDVNDIVRFGRHSNFEEGHCQFERDSEIHVHYWLRWFHVPMSYLITIDIFDSFTQFQQTKDQLNRYVNYLKKTVYPTYRKTDKFIEWKNNEPHYQKG